MAKIKRDHRAPARRRADKGRWQTVCRRAEVDVRKPERMPRTARDATRRQRRAS